MVVFWEIFGKPCTIYYGKFKTYNKYSNIGVHRILILQFKVHRLWLAWRPLQSTIMLLLIQLYAFVCHKRANKKFTFFSSSNILFDSNENT